MVLVGRFGRGLFAQLGVLIGLVGITKVRSRYVCAVAGAILVLLPVVAPKIYQAFPAWAQVIGGSAITSAALTAFVLNLLNLLCNHTRRVRQPS